jgi:hypothetical protein
MRDRPQFVSQVLTVESAVPPDAAKRASSLPRLFGPHPVGLP